MFTSKNKNSLSSLRREVRELRNTMILTIYPKNTSKELLLIFFNFNIKSKEEKLLYYLLLLTLTYCKKGAFEDNERTPWI